MINVNKLLVNVMALAFVIGMLACGLALYSMGVSGLVSWAVGIVFGVYCVAFVGSTQVARTKGVMVHQN